jgi:hypothetical protein
MLYMLYIQDVLFVVIYVLYEAVLYLREIQTIHASVDIW